MVVEYIFRLSSLQIRPGRNSAQEMSNGTTNSNAMTTYIPEYGAYYTINNWFSYRFNTSHSSPAFTVVSVFVGIIVAIVLELVL
ncbi:hypothetical protein GJ496_010020 [Pomphorhynchus laevis]|nr:hypothetical protein GJ496_010020 [Pomphorhynchus laevis]